MSAGRIVATKYCLLYELGRGGMGTVWLAEHLSLRSYVAVKLIDAGLGVGDEALRRFELEARAAAALRSPHIVQVLDFGVEDGSPYLVMEYLEGESLGARLSERGALPPAETGVILSQVGRAMTKAHVQGFVHRDLKPDNVFIADDGQGFFVKVLDFGIAKALGTNVTDDTITQSGTVLGTPHHMSPEQAQGRPVDARSDLFSMGVIAFECVTGRLPFDGDSLPALLRSICYEPIVVPSKVASVPTGFDAWFRKAVARDPAERFQTATDLVDALDPLLQETVEWTAIPSQAPTLRTVRASITDALTLETFPGEPAERRRDARVPSSIPVGINGRRDIRHTALIHNASRTGALLATRHRCTPLQSLTLTLRVQGPFDGSAVAARVVRVTARANDDMWKFDVGVRFEPPLDQALSEEIERRAKLSRF